MNTIIMNIREEVRKEIRNAVSDVLSNQLTEESKELILRCPYIINRLSENLNNMIDNFNGTDEEGEIAKK